MPPTPSGDDSPTQITVMSTSLSSAEVSPLSLRETPTVRLVFKPTLVANPHNAEASVKGVFCYQRKLRADQWEDVGTIPLSNLRAGEGVKLDLHSGEIRTMYEGLSLLYERVAQDGLTTGVHTYVRTDPESTLARVSDLIGRGNLADLLDGFITWAEDSETRLSDQLSTVDDDVLVNFDAAIGVARLQKFIGEAQDNLANGDESFWQGFLTRQPWVLSQMYAAPMVILRGQAYVGGKSISNAGGSIVDFMYRNALSSNSLLVELKTPMSELLTSTEYRNGVYGPSRELAGATQQLLHARQTLQQDYLSLTRDDPGQFNIFGTRALLVIGSLPTATEGSRLRSFEIYRNAHRGLEIVTFDELLTKGQLLLDALS